MEGTQMDMLDACGRFVVFMTRFVFSVVLQFSSLKLHMG